MKYIVTNILVFQHEIFDNFPCISWYMYYHVQRKINSKSHNFYDFVFKIHWSTMRHFAYLDKKKMYGFYWNLFVCFYIYWNFLHTIYMPTQSCNTPFMFRCKNVTWRACRSETPMVYLESTYCKYLFTWLWKLHLYEWVHLEFYVLWTCSNIIRRWEEVFL